MTNSVRFRLTVWYTGILTLVLGIFSFAVYTRLSRDAYGSVDSSLAASIDVLSRSLRHEIEEHEGKVPGEESFQGVVATVYRDSFPEICVTVLDGTRRVAHKPGSCGEALQHSEQQTPGYRTEGTVKGNLRLEVVHIVVPAAGDYTFVAETALARVEGELSNLRGVFYTAIPAALALAALGGYLLARKSLAPVVAMSSAVEKMSTQDLSQRVAIVNEADELGTLGATFNRLLGRMERAFESQKQFMADSSHELRTPIYVARTATDVILSAESRTETEYREALTTVQQQLRRLSHIVEGMFMLANADAGAYPVRMEEFYLDEVIAECLRAAKVLAQGKRIQVTGNQPEEMPCYGDEGLIRQMILALLDNAVKFTPEGGRVQLTVVVSGGNYVIDVTDGGPGIPENAQDRIFTRFFRAENTSRGAGERPPGAGLGLAIAHWIAEVHHGTVTLADSSIKGSTFQVKLTRRSSVPTHRIVSHL